MAALHAHTYRVLFLRWFFPVLAALTLVGVVALPSINEFRLNQKSKASKIRMKVEAIALANKGEGKPLQLQVSHPEFTGQDESGRPYVIRAEKILQDGLKPGASDMTLAQPVAEMTLDNTTKAFVTLNASSGLYNPVKKTLQLYGPVKVTHSEGYQLDLQDLFIDLIQGYSMSDHPVTGFGPGATLAGEKLELRDKGNHIILHGKSKLVFTQDE